MLRRTDFLIIGSGIAGLRALYTRLHARGAKLAARAASLRSGPGRSARLRAAPPGAERVLSRITAGAPHPRAIVALDGQRVGHAYVPAQGPVNFEAARYRPA